MKLSIVKELKAKIEEKAALVEALRGSLESVSIPALTGLPKTKSLPSSKIESLTAQIVDTERELENLRGEFIEVSIRLSEEVLKRVKRRSAQVLIRRYCYLETFKEIASDMKISLSQVFKLHQRGKNQFNEWEQ